MIDESPENFEMGWIQPFSAIFADPHEIHQRDRQVALSVEVENFLLARVLVGDDLVIDLDAGLLLELGQQLDDGAVARPIEEDDVELGSLVGRGRLGDVPGLGPGRLSAPAPRPRTAPWR